MADDAMEGWRQLSQQLQPSSGPYSGGFTQGGQQPNNAQWLRKISLIVYSGGGAQQGIELGQLRVVFNLHKKVLQSPDLLEARVYNLSPQTMAKVIEFNRVQLSAGYQFGNYGMLFDGTIVQFRRAKENPTDTYLEIIAGDGDKLNGAASFHRFEPGTKESAAVNTLIGDTGLDTGHISSLVGTDTFKRPWIVAGATQQYLREITQKYSANFWSDQGKINIVQQNEYMPGEAVVLAPPTGLVGIPEVTPQGIQARCLLNSKLVLGGLIKLDKSLISGIPYLPGGQEMGPNQLAQSMPIARGRTPLDVPQGTSPVGTYKVIMMEVTGDTRGQPWYQDLICIGLDASGSVVPFTVQSAFMRANPTARGGS